MSVDCIRKFKDLVDWNYIGINQEYDDQFIIEFEDKINWYNFALYQKLSISIIEKYEDLIPFEILFETHILPDEYLEKLINKEYPKCNRDLLNYFISKQPYFSEEFINKYEDKLDWNILIYNKILKDYQINNILNKLDFYKIQYLLDNHKFNTDLRYEIFYKINDLIVNDNNIDKYIENSYWKCLSKSQILSEEFIENNSEKLDWTNISKHQNLTEKFIIKFSNKIKFNILLNVNSKNKVYSFPNFLIIGPLIT